MSKTCCKAPFFNVQIHPDGVYPCCPAIVYKNFGNIDEKSFDEVWNSEIAQEFRQSCLDREYKYCNLEICNPCDNLYQDTLPDSCTEDKMTPIAEYPKVVEFCHDHHCNIKCVTCRNDFIINSKEKEEKLNSNIETKYLPILKQAEIVSLNGAGEALASKHGKKLIKAIAQKYPNIKFELRTNGILCCKNVLDELGIIDKIIGVDVSMHGFKKKTVEKIMRGTNYEKVIENIKWLSSLKKEGKIKYLNLCFVVNSINYKEMKDYAHFAEQLDANVYFWEYRKWGTEFDKNYDKWAVFEPFNIHYNSFVKIIQDPIFKQNRIHINNKLFNCKSITLREYISYRLDEIKRMAQPLFYVKNETRGEVKHKIVNLFGIKLKFRINNMPQTPVAVERERERERERTLLAGINLYISSKVRRTMCSV